ncbi:MarR family winged helix-turn-helix transcriptional regulator [Spirosoma foliorum]|uniref:Winged helix DNA-binding protein n=1 Tax=Spirosoma foliorum TaxID=2710596 RepID=A0A7G5GXH9_9BACT|nr:MarR family transcriptional regulator [Spirosoma foliorum]QMW03571.1 winged helix DNA-binding protein [Spirosoma foliorum]
MGAKKKKAILAELIDYMQNNERNWVRLIAVTKRLTDGWMQRSMNSSTDIPFKTSFMKFLANISLNGTTNQELAKRAMQPKQAMSRTVKELEAQGLIQAEKSKRDGRSSKITLTDNGKKLLLVAKREQEKLTDTYKELVGEDNFAIAVEVLYQIISYHESLDQIDDERF